MSTGLGHLRVLRDKNVIARCIEFIADKKLTSPITDAARDKEQLLRLATGRERIKRAEGLVLPDSVAEAGK